MTIRDSGDQYSTGVQVLTRNSGSPINTTFGTSLSRELMVGAEIPNFHKRLRRGELLPHTRFVQTKVEYEHLGGTYYARKSVPLSWSSISNWGGSSNISIMRVQPNMEDQLSLMALHYDGPDESVLGYYCQKAASKIYSQGWDALTFAAEFPKLVRSMGTIIEDLKRLYSKGSSKLLSLNEKDVLIKDVFQKWIQTRYEWRILVYDIQDISKVLEDVDNKRRIFSERQGTTQSGFRTVSKTYDDVDFTYSTDLQVSWEHSLRGAVSGVIIPPKIQTNPVVTSWELTKWSFILDWVIDVSTALEALSFATFSSKYVASYGVQTKVRFDESTLGTIKPGKTGACSLTWGGTLTKQIRSPTSLTFVPQLTGRKATGSMLLDLTALSRMRFRM